MSGNNNTMTRVANPRRTTWANRTPLVAEENADFESADLTGHDAASVQTDAPHTS
jgi:hypothetical protein